MLVHVHGWDRHPVAATQKGKFYRTARIIPKDCILSETLPRSSCKNKHRKVRHTHTKYTHPLPYFNGAHPWTVEIERRCFPLPPLPQHGVARFGKMLHDRLYSWHNTFDTSKPFPGISTVWRNVRRYLSELLFWCHSAEIFIGLPQTDILRTFTITTVYKEFK